VNDSTMPLAERRLEISPSRLKEAQRCMRYWAFHKLGRLPREETQPLRDGRAAHKQAENYLRHGTPPDIRTPHGRWLVEGLHLLPKPRTCLVEHRVHFDFEGLRFTCVTDFVHLASCTKGDHKFLSPRSKEFALTPETLPTDAQAVLNVLAPPALPETWLRWIYYPKGTNAGKPWAVDAQCTQAQAAEIMRDLYLLTAREMAWYHAQFAGVHPDDLILLCQAIPCTPSACFAFGKPCEYSHICNR
jgi:hypothetical protein